MHRHGVGHSYNTQPAASPRRWAKCFIMLYNILLSNKHSKYNLFGLTSHKLQKVIDAYLLGEKHITLSGTRYLLEGITIFRIFQHDVESTPEDSSAYYFGNANFHVKTNLNSYLPPKTLQMMGKEVTDSFIQDKEYGENNSAKEKTGAESIFYINEKRLRELKLLPKGNLDFSKLVKLCEELNENYRSENYLSVGMLVRTILHHIPPIFSLNSFDEIANNYGGAKDHKSFKKNMLHLNNSLKNIADSFLHLQIRKQEILPNETQVDFKQDLDVLLAEIIRITK